MAMAHFPPADNKNTPGRFEGSELLLPQAWLHAGGEQMYRQEKEVQRQGESKGQRKKEQKPAARQTIGEKNPHGLRKKEKEQDK